MGVCVDIHFARDATIEAILQDPPKVWLLVSRDDLQFYAEDAAKAARAGLLTRALSLLGARKRISVDDVDADSVLPLDAGEGESVSLDRAWGGIDSILTTDEWGSTGVRSFLLEGGRPTGAVEVGYCVPRAFTSVETAEISRTLDRLDEGAVSRQVALARRWKFETYKVSFDDPEDVAYVLEYFEDLRAALRKAAHRQLGMVITST